MRQKWYLHTTNRERDLMLQNSKLGRNKRKWEEHISAFKRKKLDRVGDRSRFDTSRVNWQDERETGGLTSGYTDITSKQPIYQVVLSCKVPP